VQPARTLKVSWQLCCERLRSTLKQAQVDIVNNQWLGPTAPLPERGSELFLPAGAGVLWMGCRLNGADGERGGCARFAALGWSAGCRR
jgi:hypothetical protein